jgi:hypothetical protein
VSPSDHAPDHSLLPHGFLSCMSFNGFPCRLDISSSLCEEMVSALEHVEHTHAPARCAPEDRIRMPLHDTHVCIGTTGVVGTLCRSKQKRAEATQ